jgi:hypothetical protein
MFARHMHMGKQYLPQLNVQVKLNDFPYSMAVAGEVYVQH